MATKWKFRDGKWRRINVEFEEQFRKTQLLTFVIRAIYDKDASLSPQEQQDAIHELPGMTAAEMEFIVQSHHSTGPKLAESIRAVISSHRATNRSNKDTFD